MTIQPAAWAHVHEHFHLCGELHHQGLHVHGACVLLEETTDQVARDYWSNGVEFVPYNQLANTAVHLVANAMWWYELAMAHCQNSRRIKVDLGHPAPLFRPVSAFPRRFEVDRVAVADRRRNEPTSSPP